MLNKLEFPRTDGKSHFGWQDIMNYQEKIFAHKSRETFPLYQMNFFYIT